MSNNRKIVGIFVQIYDIHIWEMYLRPVLKNIEQQLINNPNYELKFFICETHGKNQVTFEPINKNVMVRRITVENKGCDIFPFIKQLEDCMDNHIQYDYIIKIHTKTNDQWRNILLRPFEDMEHLLNIFNQLPEIGMVGPVDSMGIICDPTDRNPSGTGFYNVPKIKDLMGIFQIKKNLVPMNQIVQIVQNFKFDINWYMKGLDFVQLNMNEIQCVNHAREIGIPLEIRQPYKYAYNDLGKKCHKYIPGTIFTCRAEIMKTLISDKTRIQQFENLIPIGKPNDTPSEYGTYVHAMERILGILAYENDYDVRGI